MADDADATTPPWFWQRWTHRQRIHAALVAVFAVAAGIHNAALWTWFVEDAAISFAYSRHLAEGEGLVAFRGGERLEGYSNPTWVLLIALFELVGFSGFQTAPPLQILISMLTVPAVYMVAREAVEDEDSDVPVFAAAILAGTAQFAIWGSSGLENGLFNLFYALAVWRGLVEARSGQWPWSAFLWMLLACTRPEGIAYAALGGGAFLIWSAKDQRSIVPTLKWLLTFWAPFLGYHALRYAYFAYPFPQTYYAKMGNKSTKPFLWTGRGWKYIRDYSHELWQAYLVPVYALAMVGDRKYRRPIAGVMVVLLALWLVLPGTNIAHDLFRGILQRNAPSLVPYLLPGLAPSVAASLAQSRAYAVAVVAVALPLLGLGDKGWRAKSLLWSLGGMSVFFALWSAGDWMAGYRWMSLAAVPIAVLFAIGVDEAAKLVARWLRHPAVSGGLVFGAWVAGTLWMWAIQIPTLPADWVQWSRKPAPFIAGFWAAVVVALLLGAGLHFATRRKQSGTYWSAAALLVVSFLIPNITHTSWFNGHRVTPPQSVKQRVEYKQQIRRRIHLHDKIVDLDVDQGAHLFWSDHEMLDIAGLVDIPMAQHRFKRPFIREYIFREKKPHFGHVHGGWASSSKIPTHPEWRSDYIELPPYPTGRSKHPGNFLRRDTILSEGEWPERGDGDRRVDFAGGITLTGFHLPGEVGAYRFGYLEVGIQSRRKRSKNETFRVMAFLAKDGKLLRTFDLPPYYDWLDPDEVKPEEYFHGKFDLPIPRLKPGTYDLGFVVFGHQGSVWPAAPVMEGDEAPVFHVSEQASIGGRDDVPAVFARGEVVFADAVTVIGSGAANTYAEDDLANALREAENGNCERAEHDWWLAMMHRPKDFTWHEAHAPKVRAALATCWADFASALPRDRAIPVLKKARDLDWNARRYQLVASRVADSLYEDGMAAFEAEDWATAYTLLNDAVNVDRTRSWARRYAEEARHHHLDLANATNRPPARKPTKKQDKPVKADGNPAGNKGGKKP